MKARSPVLLVAMTSSFLGSAPEKRWVWVLAVEIHHDRKGFMEREIAVADGGDAAERIDGQKLWNLKLALGRFEKLPFVGDTLYLRGEQNPPSKWAPRDPIDSMGDFLLFWSPARHAGRFV